MICFKHKWNHGAHVWIMEYDWSVLAMMAMFEIIIMHSHVIRVNSIIEMMS